MGGRAKKDLTKVGTKELSVGGRVKFSVLVVRQLHQDQICKCRECGIHASARDLHPPASRGTPPVHEGATRVRRLGFEHERHGLGEGSW